MITDHHPPSTMAMLNALLHEAMESVDDGMKNSLCTNPPPIVKQD
jgi:hypothetical protein